MQVFVLLPRFSNKGPHYHNILLFDALTCITDVTASVVPLILEVMQDSVL